MTVSMVVPQIIVENRKSPRRPKQPKLFVASRDPQLDLDIKAAIKRSKLEKAHVKVDLESLPSIPVIRATEDEFKNPVSFWNKYTHLGEFYGAIKIIPPSSFKPKIPIDFNTFKFKIRQQNLKLLSSGKGFSHPQDIWMCKDLQFADKKIKRQFIRSNVPFETIGDIENTFWSLVELGNKDLVVSYGADLPSKPSKCEEYSTHPWNLHNLPIVPGSLLRYMRQTVPGVNSPWLYLGMCLSSFSWHNEDNYFGAVNYQHYGEPKVWYIVPPGRANSLEKLLVDYTSTEEREFALYSLRVQLPPNLLISNNIPVYRVVQEPNQFILLWPRTYHAGFNTGFNCNEACNIAPVNWIPMGHKSLLRYRYSRRSCVPFYSIILSSAACLHDFSYQELSEIGNMVSLLLAQEYQARSSFKMPRIEMDIDYEFLTNCFEINKILNSASIDNEKKVFGMIMNNLKSNVDETTFLEAIKFASKICTKDCGICDSPLFISSVMCCHEDMILCPSCSEFAVCNCANKIMLCRIPLLALYTLLKMIDVHTMEQYNLVKSVPPLAKLIALDRVCRPSIDTVHDNELIKLDKTILEARRRRKKDNFMSVCNFDLSERSLPTLLTCKYLISAVFEEREEYLATLT